MDLLPFLLFALVASITPGPTNLLVLSNSARFGLCATAPVALAACGAAALLVLVVGLGIGDTLGRYPQVQLAMAWAGIAWLSYLAWQIFRSPAVGLDNASQHSGKRLSMAAAAGLQVVNPKTWMMALAVVGVFAAHASDKPSRVAVLALLFFFVAVPCMGLWAALGQGLTRFCRSDAGMRRFNQAMALLLLASAWLSLLA
ncbi:threonine/homoserine/homoserine lactone efflux protein [Pseudomonas sp. TE3786]